VAYHRAKHLRSRFPDLVDGLNEVRSQAWSSHVTKITDLAEIAAALQSIDGRWAVVKGPVLAERAYGRGDLRSYMDIDVLVHRTEYGEALSLLEGAGAVLLDRNWELIRSSVRAELSLELNGRTTIDLHWHLLNETPLRRRTSWDMDALLGRVVVADVGRARVPVLDPVDALVHVATHACLSGGHRMIWLKDIERQQAAFPVAAVEVESRARAAGLWPAVHLALLRSARTFDLPLPRSTPGWSRLNRWVGTDGFRTEGPAGDGRTLAAATRRRVPQSVGAVAATVLRDRGFPWGRAHGLGRWLPPTPPTLDDLRRPAGSDADRRAYLAAIAR
jgi:hypothetical protein